MSLAHRKTSGNDVTFLSTPEIRSGSHDQTRPEISIYWIIIRFLLYETSTGKWLREAFAQKDEKNNT